MKKIAFKDVYLVPFEKEHTALFHQWRNNMEIMELSSPVIEQYSLEETVFFVQKAMLDAKDGAHYIIMHCIEDVAIGYVSIINIDYDNFSADCMIEIGEREYWGQGLGTMAMEVILEYVFNELNLNRLGLQVFSFNKRALNMYQKLGFVEEGRRREAICRLGTYYDIVMMSLLKKEFQANGLSLN